MTRFVAVARSIVITLAIVVGGPILLAATVGSPVPRPWPSVDRVRAWLDEPFDPVYASGTARVFVWLVWLLTASVIVAGLGAQLGRLRWPTLAARLPRPAQSLAAALLGSAAITSSVTGAANPAAAVAATADDATPPGPDPAAMLEHTPVDATSLAKTPAVAAGHHSGPVTTSAPTEPSTSAAAPTAAQRALGGTHRVVRGDNLWDIADHELHNPLRWREIYQLNRDNPQPDGYALRNPDRIHVGWVFALPPADRDAPDTRGNGADTTEPAAPSTQAGPSPSSLTTPPASEPATLAATTAASKSRLASPRPADTQEPERIDVRHGVTLPSRGWVSLGLATTIAAIATLLRLQQRRRTRLRYPVPLRTGPTPAPVPDSLRPADAAGSRALTNHTGGPLLNLMPMTAGVPAPIGIDQHDNDLSLFEIPGAAVTLDGPGAPAAARAITAAVLATDVADHLPSRPVLVVPADTLARLLPDGTIPHGLDPHHETFDDERLIVVEDTAAAVTLLESEMISRRRLLDEMDADTVDALNARTDHIEYQPPYVLLAPADARYTARVLAVATYRQALHLHPIILGALPDIPAVTHLDIATDGTFTTAPTHEQTNRSLPDQGRLAVLTAHDLADLLHMIAAGAPRPEAGDEFPAASSASTLDESAPSHDIDLAEIPRTANETGSAPVRLTVLGPPTLATADGPITSGLRRGSLGVLALLTAHPQGRTYEQLAADLHPDADRETGINRVRTDLNAVRSLLREATGIQGRGKFILHDSSTGRYRIDPNLIEVDLWQMLTAIDRANQTGDDEPTCLAALREAVAYYQGDFGDGQDRAWVTDYATTYRHQLLSAYARIAEILETDQPDQAIAALEHAIEHDPVNEELYQRLMRIHGRLGRSDAVRRTLHLLENRLAELGESEPSEATCRVAARQLKPTVTTHR